MSSTAYVDTFARDNLPPREQWPDLVFELPTLRFPQRQNAAVVPSSNFIMTRYTWSEPRGSLYSSANLPWTKL